MKTILIIAAVLFQTTFAEAKQYMVRVNQAANLRQEHQVLQAMIQNKILINSSTRTLKITLNSDCSIALPCTEMLRQYTLTLKKMGSQIVAEGILPIQNENTLNPTKTVVTIDQTANNSTLVRIQDRNGYSVFVGSPIEETELSF
jgi:hypothetical protein